MAVSGTVNVSASFVDTDESTGVVSEKKVARASANTASGGKVAIVTGTCGTASVSVDLSSLGYRDAAGEEVSLSLVSRVAFQATPGAIMAFSPSAESVKSLSNQVSIMSVQNTDQTINVNATAGTSSYSMLLYGS